MTTAYPGFRGDPQPRTNVLARAHAGAGGPDQALAVYLAAHADAEATLRAGKAADRGDRLPVLRGLLR